MPRKPVPRGAWRVRLESVYRTDRNERVVRVFEVVLPEAIRPLAPPTDGESSHEQRNRTLRTRFE